MLKQTFATAASLTVAFTAIAGSAEAATVHGSVSFSGLSGGTTAINPFSDTLSFLSVGVNSGKGSFTGVGVSSISSLVLSRLFVTDGNNADKVTSASYSYAALPAFIQFTNGITFNLDAGSLDRTRKAVTGLTTVFEFGALSGTFVNASGSTLGLGSVVATLSSNPTMLSSSYSLSIAAVPVPEPLTILGTLTAAGLGLGLKKKFEQEEA
ncbi:MAG: PEP-CTERM sorting domain-containing protein [Prochlorothrix sp.]|nr:PEP-CTERM sorting domain-containing protein [Prochlorothrix sp.]